MPVTQRLPAEATVGPVCANYKQHRVRFILRPQRAEALRTERNPSMAAAAG